MKAAITFHTCARKGCDNVIRVTPGRAARGDGKFCSRACCNQRGDWRHERVFELMRLRVPCEQIATDVLLSPDRTGRIMTALRAADPTLPRCIRPAAKRQVRCARPTCGRLMWRLESRIKDGQRPFCSAVCRSGARADRIALMCERVAAGEGVADVAASFGVIPRTVRKAWREMEGRVA